MLKRRVIPTPVLEVLDRSHKDGTRLVLPEQLPRPLYEAVNKVLVLAGGKWNRHAKAHVFEGSAEEAVDPIILSGRVLDAKRDYGVFYTPAPIVKEMLRQAELTPEMDVLEPEAGKGAIALAAAKHARAVDCIDILPAHIDAVRGAERIRDVMVADFLKVEPGRLYDRVMMNPPFALQQDARHVEHALKFVKPGGRLLAVMSAGTLFRSTNPTRSLRARLDELDATFTHLDPRSFKAEGTDVNTVMVSVDT